MIDNSDDDAKSLESIDFVVDILREHERNIDKLITQIADITEKLKKIPVLTDKIDVIQKKLDKLENDITLVTRYYSRDR